jgi:HD superfamily phosphohydrolase
MKTKVFRDPVYQYISCSAEGPASELALIDSPWFQRLRHCAQNGPGRLVYPSMIGTRFEHSLGVMELAGKMCDSVLDRTKYDDESIVDGYLSDCTEQFTAVLGLDSDIDPHETVRLICRYAGLCHDIGHFPLSHTFENAFYAKHWQKAFPVWKKPHRACHEVISAEIIRHLSFNEAIIPQWLGLAVMLVLLAPDDVEFTVGEGKVSFESSVFAPLAAIINGKIDADNLDYLQRDGRISGTNFGILDTQRFTESLVLAKDPVTCRYEVWPHARALSTVEATLLERYKEFKWVCFHHKVVCYDAIAGMLCADLMNDDAIKKGLFKERRLPLELPLAGDGNGGNILSLKGVSRTKSVNDSAAQRTAYGKQVMLALSAPPAQNGENHPFAHLPLSLYKHNGLIWQLNVEWFVKTDTHFFDDIWLCQMCRSPKRSKQSILYRDALVDRRKTSLSCWKDTAGFVEFANSCVDYISQSPDWAQKKEKLRGRSMHTVSIDYHKALDDMWFKHWPVDAPDNTMKELQESIAKHLRQSNLKGLTPIVRLLGWRRLIGKLQDVCVVPRNGKPCHITEHSKLLKRISELEGEIPFLVFLVGTHDDYSKALRDASGDDTIRKTALEAAKMAVSEVLLNRFDNVDDGKFWQKYVLNN